MNKKWIKLTIFFIFGTILLSVGGVLGSMMMVWEKNPLQEFFEGKAELVKRQLIQIRSGKDVNSAANIAELFSDEQIILSGFHQITLKTLDASNILHDYFEAEYLPGGYIDILDTDRAIFTSGKGDLAFLDLNDFSIAALDSNLGGIVEEQNYEGMLSPDLRGRFGLRDILIANKKIYVSLFLDITGDGCYGIGVLEASIESLNSEKQQLVFNSFFNPEHCNRDFNGHASGGRMKFLGDDLVITVGSYDMNVYGDATIPQDPNTAVGKVIAVHPDSSFSVLSMGHRNQQGLEIVNGNIFITEHGPMGGDEINIITGGHYGWPFYAYGFSYDYRDKFKMPHEYPYKKPAYYFTPSIAPSEIIFYQNSRLKRWDDKFIVSSLRGRSIFIMDFDFDANRFISAEKILIGHRIRDLNVTADGRILAVTDDQRILVISNTASDI